MCCGAGARRGAIASSRRTRPGPGLSPAALEQLFRRGKSFHIEWLTLKANPTKDPQVQFACAIRRQAQLEAVARNRMKRLLREAFRRNKGIFPLGVDLAVLVGKTPHMPSYQEVEQKLLLLARKLTLWRGES